MREQPRDHVPVTPDPIGVRPCHPAIIVALAAGWILLAIAAVALALGG